MKKVLVTGASGFIGSSLIERWLDEEVDVYAGIRSTSSKEYLQDTRIHFLEMDLSNRSALAAQFKEAQFDYIIHNAGITKASDRATYFKVNTDYTKNIVEALLQADAIPEKFVFMSSLAATGPADPVPEGILHKAVKEQPVTLYGESKLATEKYLKSIPNLPYIFIRPTAVYGPREKDLFTVFEMVNKGLEVNVGFQAQKLSFIYVKDLCEMIVQSCKVQVARIAYFATDGTVYDGPQLGRTIAQLLNKKTLKIRIPVFLIKLIAVFAEATSKITKKYPPLNRDKVSEIVALNWTCDMEPVFNELNFKPKYSLESGLKETIDWYKKENWL